MMCLQMPLRRAAKRQQISRPGEEFRSWSTCVKFSSHFLFLSTSFLLSFYRDALYGVICPLIAFMIGFFFWERMGI